MGQMRITGDTRRRWLGAAFVLIALGMLLAGETVLDGRLSPLGFVLFWLGCLVSTCLAIVVAFVDVWVIRSRTRREQREFLEDTLREIARRKRAQPEPRDDRPDKHPPESSE